MAAVSSMAGILDEIERRLADIIPSIAPDVLFRPCGDSTPIEHQSFGDALDGCRRFEVSPGILAGYQGAMVGNGRGGEWDGDLLFISDSIEIAIRYEWPCADAGLRYLKRMIATDQQLVMRQIHPLTADYPDPIILHDIYPTGSVQVEDIDKNADVIARIIRIQYAVTTSLGDP
jgi:hypothetical protein